MKKIEMKLFHSLMLELEDENIETGFIGDEFIIIVHNSEEQEMAQAILENYNLENEIEIEWDGETVEICSECGKFYRMDYRDREDMIVTKDGCVYLYCPDCQETEAVKREKIDAALNNPHQLIRDKEIVRMLEEDGFKIYEFDGEPVEYSSGMYGYEKQSDPEGEMDVLHVEYDDVIFVENESNPYTISWYAYVR